MVEDDSHNEDIHNKDDHYNDNKDNNNEDTNHNIDTKNWEYFLLQNLFTIIKCSRSLVSRRSAAI